MRQPPKFKHEQTVAAQLRGLKMWSPLNDKTPKSEKMGFLQAILYLAPATLGGGKTLCPHSTEACRAGCLFTAGRGVMPRVENARQRRTQMYLHDRDRFFDELIGELVQMQNLADAYEMGLAVRLNGTADIAWERELIDGRTLFEMFDRARFFDYSRWPAKHRKVPAGWHLTYSLADDPFERAVEHLREGRNVAIVTKSKFPQTNHAIVPGLGRIALIDGDEHDARFLDPSPAVVLLKPKGRLLRGGPMVRTDILANLALAAKETA